MSNCGQACPYNTLEGCKAKEYNEICPLTNTAVPITEYRPTNEDRIIEELAETLSGMCKIAEQCDFCPLGGNCPGGSYDLHVWYKWLQQPAEGD